MHYYRRNVLSRNAIGCVAAFTFGINLPINGIGGKMIFSRMKHGNIQGLALIGELPRIAVIGR